MGWYAPWPHCADGKMVNLVIDGTNFPAGIDPRLKRLIVLLGEETERRGYNLKDPGCWGFACRAIDGTSTPSNHSQGKAVDVNAPSNPRGTRGDIPLGVVRLWEAYGFEWGGRWSFTDPMHFEFSRTVRSARRLTARAERAFGDLDYRVGDRTFERIDGAISALKGKARKGDPGDDFHIKVVRGEDPHH